MLLTALLLPSFSFSDATVGESVSQTLCGHQSNYGNTLQTIISYIGVLFVYLVIVVVCLCFVVVGDVVIFLLMKHYSCP